ncbi:hypothetical protein Hanom_Chr05g00428941 [Helianthus anomalus]
MKMARFQPFWIQMRKNKPLDESHKTGQTTGTKYDILHLFIYIKSYVSLFIAKLWVHDA